MCACFLHRWQLSDGGLLVDLATFLSFSESCAKWHNEKTGNSVFLRIKRVPEPNAKDASTADDGDGTEERPLKKPSILGIGETAMVCPLILPRNLA